MKEISQQEAQTVLDQLESLLRGGYLSSDVVRTAGPIYARGADAFLKPIREAYRNSGHDLAVATRVASALGAIVDKPNADIVSGNMCRIINDTKDPKKIARLAEITREIAMRGDEYVSREDFLDCHVRRAGKDSESRVDRILEKLEKRLKEIG